jgi:hypothetical protein
VLAPEIALVSRALYYSCSILGFGVTPGQALCDFALVGMGPSTHGTSKSAVSKATKSRLYSVIALYALLPYVYERKSLIWSNVSTMLEIVAAPEPGLLSPGSSLQSAAADSSTARSDGSETDEGHVESRSGDVTEGQPVDSFLTKILRAIAGSVASISSSGTERVEALCSFLSDVHKFLFFQYGRLATSVFSSVYNLPTQTTTMYSTYFSYLEIPLRLAQLRLITRSPPKSQVRRVLYHTLHALCLTRMTRC